MASQSHQYYQQPHRPQQSPVYYSQEQQQNLVPAKPRSSPSQRTHRSNDSKHDYHHETHEEKEAKRLHSKADPTLAMNEAEPAMVAAMKSDTPHISIRSIQHKDPWGNPIADPDRSNPTRNRWERPLDTIRSFEAAIDGNYHRKTQSRPDDSAAQWSRRSSAHPPTTPRFPQERYYGNRPASYRSDSQHGYQGHGSARNSYFDAQNAGGGYNGGYEKGYGNRHMSRERSQRGPPDAHYQGYGRGEQAVYPMPHKDRSYETVTSAVPSGGSDPAGYQTDPTSSDNSSIDRISPGKRNEPVSDYGIGFSQSQAYDAPNFVVNSLPPHHGHIQEVSPSSAVPRNEPYGQYQPTQQQDSNQVEKRRSWLSRRFSRS